MKILYTIGHSTHKKDVFVHLLNRHAVTAVCDVRSNPYSRRNPQFNRENLQKTLQFHNIAYVYFGSELGPRSSDSSCYENDKVQYDRLARTRSFHQGLNRLRKGSKSFSIALMCSEKDPIMCHRMILVSRNMRCDDLDIKHILTDGSLESNRAAEKRLMNKLKIDPDEMFYSEERLICRAYDMQSKKIAFIRKQPSSLQRQRIRESA